MFTAVGTLFIKYANIQYVHSSYLLRKCLGRTNLTAGDICSRLCAKVCLSASIRSIISPVQPKKRKKQTQFTLYWEIFHLRGWGSPLLVNTTHSLYLLPDTAVLLIYIDIGPIHYVGGFRCSRSRYHSDIFNGCLLKGATQTQLEISIGRDRVI